MKKLARVYFGMSLLVIFGISRCDDAKILNQKIDPKKVVVYSNAKYAKLSSYDPYIVTIVNDSLEPISYNPALIADYLLLTTPELTDNFKEKWIENEGGGRLTASALFVGFVASLVTEGFLLKENFDTWRAAVPGARYHPRETFGLPFVFTGVFLSALDRYVKSLQAAVIKDKTEIDPGQRLEMFLWPKNQDYDPIKLVYLALKVEEAKPAEPLFARFLNKLSEIKKVSTEDAKALWLWASKKAKLKTITPEERANASRAFKRTGIPVATIAALVAGALGIRWLAIKNKNESLQRVMARDFVEASFHNNSDRAKALIDQGLDVNAKTHLNVPLLNQVVHHGRPHLAKYLIERGANVNAQDFFGTTALMEAARWKRQEMAALLFANGAKLDMRDNFGQTAIYQAAHWRNFDMVNLLLKNGADATISDGSGNTTAMAAVEGYRSIKAFPANESRIDWLTTIKKLIDTGIDVNARNKDNKTIVDIAKSTSDNDLIEWLKRRQEEAAFQPFYSRVPEIKALPPELEVMIKEYLLPLDNPAKGR